MADKKAFPIRPPKKNPFQLHKEAEEAKKKRLDEEAAQVYEEFVTSFDGGSAQAGPKAFVRGGVVEPGSRPSSEPTPAPDKRLGTRYVPSFIPPSMAAASKAREEKPASVFDLPARGDKGKPRAIDSVLVEMQREQQERESRRERGGSGFDVLPEEAGAHRGSHDTGDPGTTNLYVGNLAPTLDEHTLKLAFGKYGPIASIKIMWPRDDEQRASSRSLSGFVAYMARQSAEEALDKMQGMVLHNSELRLGWSKAVVLPAVPCWPPPSGYEPGFSAGPATARDESQHALLPPRVEVRLPRSAARLHLIDTLASHILLDGTVFENMISTRERENPDFAFLRDHASEEYLYLKWRVYAFAQGDSLALWREQEFQMVQGGSVWVPPKMDDLRNVVAAGPETAGGSAAASAAVELTEAERDAFEDILRTLTVERSSIRAAMLFALDHAPAAAEISDTLIQALSLPETPVAVKVARLFLLSDVLHNSNAAQSNAAAYRSHLISRLPLVFESLHEAYSALDSRITAQELRRRVTSVLRAWAEWFMFGEHFLGGLEATFVGLRSSAASRLVDDASLRAALEALSAEDLERRCRDNGLSTLAGRDGCIARLLALDCFRRAQRGELPPEEQEEQQAPAEPHERGTWTVVSEPPASRWTSADAAPESEPAPCKRSRSPGADGSPRRSPRKW